MTGWGRPGTLSVWLMVSVDLRWAAVMSTEPRLGRLMREQLIDPGVLLVGSIRRDGRPRISGFQRW